MFFSPITEEEVIKIIKVLMLKREQVMTRGVSWGAWGPWPLGGHLRGAKMKKKERERKEKRKKREKGKKK